MDWMTLDPSLLTPNCFDSHSCFSSEAAGAVIEKLKSFQIKNSCLQRGGWSKSCMLRDAIALLKCCIITLTLGQLVMKKRNEEEGGTWLAVVGGGDKGFSRWGNNGDKGFTARSGG